MTKIDQNIADETGSSDPSNGTKLTRAQLHESLSWLFGLIALVELGIILKLLLEGGR